MKSDMPSLALSAERPHCVDLKPFPGYLILVTLRHSSKVNLRSPTLPSFRILFSLAANFATRQDECLRRETHALLDIVDYTLMEVESLLCRGISAKTNANIGKPQ